MPRALVGLVVQVLDPECRATRDFAALAEELCHLSSLRALSTGERTAVAARG